MGKRCGNCKGKGHVVMFGTRPISCGECGGSGNVKPCPVHPWATLDADGYCPACEEPLEYLGKDEG